MSDFSLLAAEKLRRESDNYASDADLHQVDPAARAQAIAALAQVLHARKVHTTRKRYAQWGLAGLALAAASVGILFGVSRLMHGTSSPSFESATNGAANAARRLPSFLHGAASDAVVDGVVGGAVHEGSTVRMASDGTLAYATGSTIELVAGSRVHLREQSARQIVGLLHGSLTAHVAKLKADERFVVQTSDSEIEVRGTAFRVSIVDPDPACGDGTPTRLVVTEGIVVVRHGTAIEVQVPAGHSWPSCDEPMHPAGLLALAAATGQLTAPQTVPPIGGHAAAPTATPSTAVQIASSADVERSALAEQNDLFAEAMLKKRSGDRAGAVAILNELSTKYPRSSLAESALAERMKLLAQTDPAAGAASARDYLRRFPTGFARKDAAEIVQRSGQDR